jgi:hypothetical protein
MKRFLKKIVSFLFVLMIYGNLWSQRIVIYDDTSEGDDMGLIKAVFYLLITIIVIGVIINIIMSLMDFFKSKNEIRYLVDDNSKNYETNFPKVNYERIRRDMDFMFRETNLGPGYNLSSEDCLTILNKETQFLIAIVKMNYTVQQNNIRELKFYNSKGLLKENEYCINIVNQNLPLSISDIVVDKFTEYYIEINNKNYSINEAFLLDIGKISIIKREIVPIKIDENGFAPLNRKRSWIIVN